MLEIPAGLAQRVGFAVGLRGVNGPVVVIAGVREGLSGKPIPGLRDAGLMAFRGESVDVGAGFLNLALWCAVLFPLSRLLWRAGVRRYSAMGA